MDTSKIFSYTAYLILLAMQDYYTDANMIEIHSITVSTR